MSWRGEPMLRAGRREDGDPGACLSRRWGLAFVAVSGVLVLTGCATSVGGTAVGPVPGAVPATERSSAPGFESPAPGFDSTPTAEPSPPSSGRGGGTHTVSDLPVPIEFSLPDGWESIDPSTLDTPGVAFVAVNRDSSARFTSNLTIYGEVRDNDTTLTEIADEASTDGSGELGGAPEVVHRKKEGEGLVAAITQVVEFPAPEGSGVERLQQTQTLVQFPDSHGPDRRGIIMFGATAAPDDPSAMDVLERVIDTLREVER
ncbi:hypothetical protein [Saccharomonospora iraqiensis]|uniref:hypothetical protein n=1 Tax=Saccharomonospora iraqiensis TaxID=52698 RepID=UPI001F465505|nr:hypothetical protein [Saccharomonospora iraqiensis]